MSRPFQGKLRQFYRLSENALLVLDESYQGDVGPGDALSVEVGEDVVTVTVFDLAWGSALSANKPPLSLIVKGLSEDQEPVAGAKVESPADDQRG